MRRKAGGIVFTERDWPEPSILALVSDGAALLSGKASVPAFHFFLFAVHCGAGGTPLDRSLEATRVGMYVQGLRVV